MGAGTGEVGGVAEVALEVGHPVVRGELEHQPLPFHGRFVRNQQHLVARKIPQRGLVWSASA